MNDESSGDGHVAASAVADPTPNELLLSKRLVQLEKERDDLRAELDHLKAKQPAKGDDLHIPPEMIPMLSILRSHIRTLTRDNEALRYTFLGSTTPPGTEDTRVDVDGVPGPRPRIAGVDLHDVLGRVKELVRENEELGEMVLHAGQADVVELEKALADSHAVITSLDSDLEHHLAVVQTLQKELEQYRARYGPLSAEQQDKPPMPKTPTQSRGPRPRASIAPDSSGPGRSTAGAESKPTPGPTRQGSVRAGGRDGIGGTGGSRGRHRGAAGGRRGGQASQAGGAPVP